MSESGRRFDVHFRVEPPVPTEHCFVATPLTSADQRSLCEQIVAQLRLKPRNSTLVLPTGELQTLVRNPIDEQLLYPADAIEMLDQRMFKSDEQLQQYSTFARFIINGLNPGLVHRPLVILSEGALSISFRGSLW